MGWYAKTNARMMAKMAGDDVASEDLEQYRKDVTASRVDGVRAAHRERQDDRDRKVGERKNRKADRRARRKGVTP